MLTIGQAKIQVKKLMEFRNIPNHKLAIMMGIGAPALRTFLLGGNIGLKTFQKIESFLEEHYMTMTKLEQ